MLETEQDGEYLPCMSPGVGFDSTAQGNPYFPSLKNHTRALSYIGPNL